MVKKTANDKRDGGVMLKKSRPADATPDTRLRLLNAAIDEFCKHGRTGASTARIVAAANCNIRMLYHYFGNKDGLYRAALLEVYARLRDAEAQEDFWSVSPKESIERLAGFTFDYMQANPSFPKMMMVENLAGGEMVARSDEPFVGSRVLVKNLAATISRGHFLGEFCRKPDALDVYLTILALSFIHVSNRHTLSVTFRTDVASDDFVAARRKEVLNAVLGSLGSNHDK